MDLSDSSYRLKSRKHKIYVKLLVAIIVYDYMMFPLPILAKEANKARKLQPVASFAGQESVALTTANTTPITSLDISKKVQAEPIVVKKTVKIKDHGYHSMTAYNSEVGQTDGDPCTTANGFNLCKHNEEDTVAANFLKFGTKVRIPELFGDRVFVVRDRMNSRYQERVDVWFKDHQDAIKFGVRKAKIEIVEEL
jgi:3D (Asp-Asp-Asp) domain-containing protein